MNKKKPIKLDKYPYLQEKILYGIWKYANAYRLTGKTEIGFNDIASPDFSTIGSCLILMSLHMKNMGIQINGLYFYDKGYFTYTKDEDRDKYTKDGISKNMKKSIKAIIKNDFTYDDFMQAGILSEKYHLAEWFQFPTKLNSKNRKKIDAFLAFYIKEFINDNLAINKKSYYRFEKQKESMLYELKQEANNMGNTFIIESTEQNSYNPRPDYILTGKSELFIHTLIALEKLEYLNIENIWVTDMDIPPEDQTMTYKVRITILPELIEKWHKADNWLTDLAPTKLKEESKNKPPIFDADTSILTIQDDQAIISRTKNSNPHIMLSLLMKKPYKVWEPAELWAKCFNRDIENYTTRKDWKRLSNTGRDLNEKIALQTKVKDFVSVKTTSIQINKKHIK